MMPPLNQILKQIFKHDFWGFSTFKDDRVLTRCLNFGLENSKELTNSSKLFSVRNGESYRRKSACVVVKGAWQPGAQSEWVWTTWFRTAFISVIILCRRNLSQRKEKLIFLLFCFLKKECLFRAAFNLACIAMSVNPVRRKYSRHIVFPIRSDGLHTTDGWKWSLSVLMKKHLTTGTHCRGLVT
jgi:hypothetical protein